MQKSANKTEFRAAEIWKPVPSEPGVLASSLGRILLPPIHIPMPRGGYRTTEGEADSGAEDDSDAEDGPRDLFHVDEDSKEFLDGKAAGEAGFDKSDCPFKDDAAKAATWVAGWEAA